MKTAILLLILLLTGCAVNNEGSAYLQTPKISARIPHLNVILWGYGVVGFSRIDPDHETLAK